MNHLDELPTEILSLVLQHIDIRDQTTCTFINKRFHTLTNPLLWRCLILDPLIYDKVTTTIIHSNSTALGRHVRCLLYFVPFDSRPFLSLLERLPLLEILNVPGFTVLNIEDDVIHHVPRFCPHLRVLFLSKVDIGQRTLTGLAHHCHRLTLISFSRGCTFPANTFELLGATCPLQDIYVELDGMHDISDEDQHTAADKTALDLTRCHQLKRLSLSKAPTYFARRLLTLSSSSSSVWPQLVTLVLHADVDDSHVIPLIKTHPNIKTLEFKKATALTDATLDAIATYLPTTITKLGFKYSRNLTARGIYQLVRRCSPRLTLVGIKGCQIKPTLFADVLGNDYPKRMENYSTLPYYCAYLHTLDQHVLDNIRRSEELPAFLKDEQQQVNNSNDEYDTALLTGVFDDGNDFGEVFADDDDHDDEFGEVFHENDSDSDFSW